MKLLLDTCTFIWLADAAESLSDGARDLLDDPGADLILSDVSVWEVCLKWQSGKLKLPSPPRSWIDGQASAWALSRLPIDREHFYRSVELPNLHRDPFDRLLVAQALSGNLTIVTPDAAIRQYPVAVAW